MSDVIRNPRGELIIRTQTMPADTNQNGDIFGGWIMSQMDLAGGMLATEIARGRIATVAVEGMTFHKPVKVGDAVCVHGECIRVGNTSMTIHLEVWIKPFLRSDSYDSDCVTEGVFTYVAIDNAGRPRSVPKG